MWATKSVSIWRCPFFLVTISLAFCLARVSTRGFTGSRSALGETISLSKSIFVANHRSTGSDRAPKNNEEITFDDNKTQQNHGLLSDFQLEPLRDANQGLWQLQSMAQLENPINEIRNDRSPDISLYQTIKNQANNRSRDDEQAIPLRGLDRDFLSLFDELWKIKNNSVTALVRLNYFQEMDQRQKPSKVNNLLMPDRNLNSNTAIPRNRSGQQPKLDLKSGLARASSNLGLWFATAQQRVHSAWDSFCTRMLQKLELPISQLGRQPQGQPARRTDIFENTDRPNRAEDPDARPNNTRVLTKRSVETEAQSQDQSGACIVMTSDERNKCMSMELQINLSLNNSFPGTLKSVEDNCRLITSLFADCWPQKMRELRNSLSSWNETLIQHADFQLPAYFLKQDASTEPLTCGVGPRLPQYLQDRINWMWLNLCIDKKFRQDYVDNLKCLSTWNQEKAQQVCSHEYRRMQSYLASQAETGNAVGSNFEWARGSNNQRTRQLPSVQAHELSVGKTTERSSLSQSSDEEVPDAVEQVISSNSSARNISAAAVSRMGLSESELTDREVSSKMLCCMFDQFLRCVHRQAVRDCGRPGAQFVVNFMSRIGTDDMKFLCNSETKSVHRGKPTSRRGGSHEARSPFIDGQYCTDPRIQSGLSNHQLDRGGSSGGGFSSASGSRSSSNRNKSRDKTNINHDPTFFGSESVVQSAALPSVCVNSSLVVIFMLYLITRAF